MMLQSILGVIAIASGWQAKPPMTGAGAVCFYSGIGIASRAHPRKHPKNERSPVEIYALDLRNHKSLIGHDESSVTDLHFDEDGVLRIRHESDTVHVVSYNGEGLVEHPWTIRAALVIHEWSREQHASSVVNRARVNGDGNMLSIAFSGHKFHVSLKDLRQAAGKRKLYQDLEPHFVPSPDGTKGILFVNGAKPVDEIDEAREGLAFLVDCRTGKPRYVGHGFKALWVDGDRVEMTMQTHDETPVDKRTDFDLLFGHASYTYRVSSRRASKVRRLDVLAYSPFYKRLLCAAFVSVGQHAMRQYTLDFKLVSGQETHWIGRVYESNEPFAVGRPLR